jgi:tetratricopeptide (TPR) repeat protein
MEMERERTMRRSAKKSGAALLGLFLAIILLLAGCAPQKVEITGLPPEAAASPTASLLADANQALARNDLHGAEAYLERALRLEAGNGLLWHTLAETKYRQGNYRQAVQLALRAKSLLPAADSLVRENDLLLSRSYHKLGQEEQARQAAERAESFGITK